MGFFEFFRFGLGPTPLSVTQDRAGNWLYTMFSSRGNQHQFLSAEAKLRMILASPACMTIFSLQADMFSLCKVHSRVKPDSNEKQIPDYLTTLRKTPNYKSGWTQFFWDYMFWSMQGTAYLYKPGGGKLLDQNNPVEWLNPAKFMWEPSLVQKMMDFIFTRATYKEVTSNRVRYIQSNGKVKYIPLNEIVPIHDLSSNMNDNFYVGISRVDALYKIICNSEATLDAKSVNIDFSKKWMVSGKQDPNNVNELPMDEKEKKSIEDRVEFGKTVQANKSAIDIKRFTDNMAKLELDNIYSADLYQIGKMYNIPRDIIEAYTSSSRGATYENARIFEYLRFNHSKEIAALIYHILVDNTGIILVPVFFIGYIFFQITIHAKHDLNIP